MIGILVVVLALLLSCPECFLSVKYGFVSLLLGSGGHIRPSAPAQPGLLRPTGKRAHTQYCLPLHILQTVFSSQC